MISLALKHDLKSLIVKSGWTMTAITEELNRRHGTNTTIQNFSTKLRKETFKYTEVDEILEIIGYKIQWIESTQKPL